MRTYLPGLLILIAVVSLPGQSSAQLSVQSGHEARLRVAGDARGYARVTATRPLVIEVAGPGELTVVLRQELDPDQVAGQTITGVSLLEGRRAVESFRLRGTRLGRFERDSLHSRPTEAVEHNRTVRDGTHVFALRVDTSGHQVVASIGFTPDEDDLALMPLVPLSGPGEEAGDELPLVALTPPADEEDDDQEIPLVGLVPPPSDDGDEVAMTGEPDTGREVRVARVTDGGDAPDDPISGGLVGRPLRDSPASPRTVRMVLGMRGLAAATGMGGGTVGGGVDLLVDSGMLDGKLKLGVSTDLVAYSLVIQRYLHDGNIARSSMSVQTIPVMAVASYVLPVSTGPLRWEVVGGVGPVIATVSDERRSNRAFLAGGVLSAGPTLDAGPGAVSMAVRASGGYGNVADGRGVSLMRGPIGGLGVTVGYVISI